ncbi:MAG: MFS transporter [Planctomycetia bacterium]|nr:MFS transporter [Planctomycetia bacterium]
MSQAPAGGASRLTSTQWLICTIAAIGFAFDIYELLMLPLIARPALMELGNIQPGSPAFTKWIGLLFYVPAVAGGIFGLLGGYLTDRLGRRAVLTWSILLYAFAAFAAGFSTSLYMLLFFRCLVFIGVCVEFVAAVAWLAELFEDPHQREKVLGFTQAFSSIGGLLVAVANGLAVAWAVNTQYDFLFGIKFPAMQLPAIQLPEFLTGTLGQIKDSHAPWRYTLMSGLIPAIPLILIRPFLPESPSWKRKREAGTMRRPSIAELFSPQLKRTTLITTLMFTCSFAAAFGAIQQLPQIIPGIPEVQEKVKAAVEKDFPEEKKKALIAEIRAKYKSEAELSPEEKIKRDDEIKRAVIGATKKISNPIEQSAASHATKIQEFGGLFGRFALAGLALFITSRRKLLRVFLIPGIIAMPIIFAYAGTTSLNYLHIGIFIAGLLTVGQFSFWGNYLPRVYPVHLRGTGESFAANMGGRLIGTSFAAVTTTLAAMLVAPGPNGSPPNPIAVAHMTAYVAAGVALTVYVVNYIASFWLPEPKEGEFDE